MSQENDSSAKREHTISLKISLDNLHEMGLE